MAALIYSRCGIKSVGIKYVMAAGGVGVDCEITDAYGREILEEMCTLARLDPVSGERRFYDESGR